MFPLGETVTWHRRSAVTQDSDGNDVGAFVDTDLRGVAVYPRGATGTSAGAEVDHGRDTIASGKTVVLTSDLAVAAVDQFTVGGDRYEVDGTPNRFRSPLTMSKVTEIHLTRVEG